jgi:radical SAM modification target selenobiotic family peptide
MDSKELKKFLAGLSIAGLLAGVNIPAAGFAAEGKSG